MIGYRIVLRKICFESLSWIDLRIRLYDFKIFNELELTKTTLKTVLRIFLRIC